MFDSLKLTSLSLPQITDFLGGSNPHSTVKSLNPIGQKVSIHFRLSKSSSESSSACNLNHKFIFMRSVCF